MTDLLIHRLPRPARPLTWAVAGRALALFAAFTPGGKAHRYHSCRDRDCERLPCEAYRDGYADGWREGYAAGRGDRS